MTEAELLERARARLAPEPIGRLDEARGDHDLNAGVPRARDPKQAAVLVPIVRRPAGPTLLFTTRSSRLRAHSGQVAFPGGRIDAGDASPWEAALREAGDAQALSQLEKLEQQTRALVTQEVEQLSLRFNLETAEVLRGVLDSQAGPGLASASHRSTRHSPVVTHARDSPAHPAGRPSGGAARGDPHQRRRRRGSAGRFER